MLNVLIVEDDKAINNLIRTSLADAGYACTCAFDGASAADFIEEHDYDLVLLDIMLPEVDGYELLEYIKPTGMPVIFLTAKGSVEDRIKGLKLGADDYIVKPFSAAEVMARARAILRRIPQQEESKSRKLVIANLTIDIDNYMVTIDDKEVPLTKREKELLWLLASNSKKVFSRDNLLDSLWGYDYFGDSRTVDSHIKRLRAKLDAFEHPGWNVKTIWGVGYRFEITEP